MVGIANGGLIMDIEAPLDRLAIPKSKGDRGLGKERPQRPYSIFGRELDISRVQIGSPIPDASLISISSPIIRSWMKVPITVILANGDFTSSQPLASRLARPSAW
jgi:hypothetical protein